MGLGGLRLDRRAGVLQKEYGLCRTLGDISLAQSAVGVGRRDGVHGETTCELIVDVGSTKAARGRESGARTERRREDANTARGCKYGVRVQIRCEYASTARGCKDGGPAGLWVGLNNRGRLRAAVLWILQVRELVH